MDNSAKLSTNHYFLFQLDTSANEYVHYRLEFFDSSICLVRHTIPCNRLPSVIHGSEITYEGHCVSFSDT